MSSHGRGLPARFLPAGSRQSTVRRAFARYLSKSYGKGGHSESLDPQSFFDADHCRPKLEIEAPVADVADRMPIAKQVKVDHIEGTAEQRSLRGGACPADSIGRCSVVCAARGGHRLTVRLHQCRGCSLPHGVQPTWCGTGVFRHLGPRVTPRDNAGRRKMMVTPLLEIEGTWEEICCPVTRSLWPKNARPRVSWDRTQR